MEILEFRPAWSRKEIIGLLLLSPATLPHNMDGRQVGRVASVRKKKFIMNLSWIVRRCMNDKLMSISYGEC